MQGEFYRKYTAEMLEMCSSIKFEIIMNLEVHIEQKKN
jgi:hypothetical protein